MLIFYKKIFFSRLARQILKIFGTKIRKCVPHDMKPVLATNWPTFYDLMDFFFKFACNYAELLGYPKNGFKKILITTNHFLHYYLYDVRLIGPRLKTKGSIKSILSPRPSVCLSIRSFITAYLQNRSNNFSEIWYEVSYP